MKGLKVLAKDAEEAIAKIREAAEKEKRGVLYVFLKNHFFWITWAFLCACLAFVSERPAQAALMLVIPLGIILLLRFLKTAPGIILLAAFLAFGLYQMARQVPKMHQFLDGTTYKFISGSGAMIIPHRHDVVRLYAQDDFYIADHLKSIGDTVQPGETLLIADLGKEMRQVEEMEKSFKPKLAYLEYLLAENQRKQEAARLQIKLNKTRQQQVAFEKHQFEVKAQTGDTLIEAYRKTYRKGLLSQKEFAALEKEYERLKNERSRLAVEANLISLDVDKSVGQAVFETRQKYERENLNYQMAKTEIQKAWLRQTAFIKAPTGSKDRFLTQLAPIMKGTPRLTASGLVEKRAGSNGYLPNFVSYPARPGIHTVSLRSSDRMPQVRPHYRKWDNGELIYLTGSSSSTYVRRGQLVAEIWTGKKRKRIGFTLPRSKMVGVQLGTPVNFIMDQEVGDFDSIVYGKIERIRQYPDSDVFFIEAGHMGVAGKEKKLDEFPIGLAGNFRVGLREITHKEKYLKVKGDAQNFSEMWKSMKTYVHKYLEHKSGEDFISESPERDGAPGRPKQVTLRP